MQNQDIFISPITGYVPKDYVQSKTNFIDQNKTNFLNKILRGELSAVEAYEQVIPTFSDESHRFRLSEIRNDHDRNIERLKILVEHARFAPDEKSGPWGTIVSALVGAAKLVGTTAELKMLQEGEEHGLKLYTEALDYNLTDEERQVILQEITPNLHGHIASLENMISEQNDDSQ